MKKIAVGLVAIFGLILLQPAHAEVKKSIAIIDTAIDSSLPEFNGKIVQEVCLMEEIKCPNGKAFQEGLGSATLPPSEIYFGGFNHGTIMSLIATKTNPDMNIVFIRIFPKDKTGNVAYNAANANSTVKQALDWVIKNKVKFNIVAVSASLGQRPLKTGTDYCKVDRFDASFKASVVSLQTLGVASIFATGNDADKTRINYPACVPEVVSVASVGPRGNTENYNNDAKELDFYALGRQQVSIGDFSGTSAANAALAAYWVKYYKGNFQMTYDYLKSVATTSDTAKNNTVVDILK